MEDIKQAVERVAANVEQVIVGKRKAVELVLIALLCKGHVLLEDVPGTGKTTLAKTIARSIGLQLQTHPVHARSPTLRCDWHLDLQSAIARVRVSPRPGDCPDCSWR